MVKSFTFALLALSSVAVAQRGSSWDQWKDLCGRPEYQEYCRQWIDWVGTGQQGQSPQDLGVLGSNGPPSAQGSTRATGAQPQKSTTKSSSKTPPPPPTRSSTATNPWISVPPWSVSSTSTPARTTPGLILPIPKSSPSLIEPSRSKPPPPAQPSNWGGPSQQSSPESQAQPAPSIQGPVTAVCTVEIYSFTTRPEGQRTRTRTRTIIMPFVSTITSLLTTETTSIAVETIVQEQREQTITSSQTICNP